MLAKNFHLIVRNLGLNRSVFTLIQAKNFGAKKSGTSGTTSDTEKKGKKGKKGNSYSDKSFGSASDQEVSRNLHKINESIAKNKQEKAAQSSNQTTEPIKETVEPKKPIVEEKVVKVEPTKTVEEKVPEVKPVQNNEESNESIKIYTVKDHKPPLHEDTVGGRYSSTLFIVASKENSLYNVYEDMKYISSIYQNSEPFRIFCDNSGLNSQQINSFIGEFSKFASFSETTIKFCDLIGKNKRFMYINDIAKKFIKLYTMLTKEEKITIISAYALTSEEKSQVKTALESNPDNKEKTFIIDYQINESLLGGLQMYTENKFMDLTLSSRIERIKDEINKI